MQQNEPLRGQYAVQSTDILKETSFITLSPSSQCILLDQQDSIELYGLVHGRGFELFGTLKGLGEIYKVRMSQNNQIIASLEEIGDSLNIWRANSSGEWQRVKTIVQHVCAFEFDFSSTLLVVATEFALISYRKANNTWRQSWKQDFDADANNNDDDNDEDEDEDEDENEDENENENEDIVIEDTLITTMRFNHDSTLLATIREKKVTLRSLTVLGLGQKQILNGEIKRAQFLSFNHDSTYLICGNLKGSFRIWHKCGNRWNSGTYFECNGFQWKNFFSIDFANQANRIIATSRHRISIFQIQTNRLKLLSSIYLKSGLGYNAAKCNSDLSVIVATTSDPKLLVYQLNM